jgi:hypothetical protein
MAKLKNTQYSVGLLVLASSYMVQPKSSRNLNAAA